MVLFIFASLVLFSLSVGCEKKSHCVCDKISLCKDLKTGKLALYDCQTDADCVCTQVECVGIMNPNRSLKGSSSTLCNILDPNRAHAK